jgi:hypothetical protein
MRVEVRADARPVERGDAIGNVGRFDRAGAGGEFGDAAHDKSSMRRIWRA